MLEKLSPILPSRDIDATEAFWLRLGFATVYKDVEESLILERDDVELHFLLNPDLDPRENDAGGYLRPSDIDALDAEWGALGLPVTGCPRMIRAEDKPWGTRELAVVDADGNLMRAVQELD